MLNWGVRGLLIVAAAIAGWFVAEDAPNFGVIQMIVLLLLLTFIVAIVAFWPARWKRSRKNSD